MLWRTYAGRLASGRLATADFVRLRLIRLYPIFALGIGFGALFLVQGIVRGSEGHIGMAAFGESLAFNLAMLPSPASPLLYPLNQPSWSLFYELLANFALAAWLVRWPQRTLMALVVCTGIGLVGYGYAAGSLGGGDEWRATPVAILRTAFSFTFGAIIAGLHPERARPASALALGCFAVLGLTMAIEPGPMRAARDIAAVLLISPALLVVCSRIEPPHFTAPAAAVLGEVSFALYAVHLPLAHAFQSAARVTGLPLWLVAVPYLGAALALAWACARWLDVPLRAALTRRFIRRSPV